MEPQKAPSLLNAGPPARAVIQAVVFDLGRVMIDFDHMVAVERIRKFTDKADQEIFDLIFNSELTRLFEEGRLNPRDFFCRLKTMLGLRLEYAEFVPIWNEIFFLTDENRRIYRLAQRLKERFTIALLSNVNRLHFEYIQKNFPIFEVFDYVIASFQVGATKPDPRIYQKMLKILKVKPAAVFYTDDRKELIEAALALGIRGSVFGGLKQLEHELASCGVRLDPT